MHKMMSVVAIFVVTKISLAQVRSVCFCLAQFGLPAA